MSKAIKMPRKGEKRAEAANVEPVAIGASQGWRLTYGGQHRTVMTTSSSAAAIEEASRIYGDALSRLAKR